MMFNIGQSFGPAADFSGRRRGRPPGLSVSVTVAAEHFFDLCQSDIHRRRLWNLTQKPTRAEIRSNVANAMTTFMRAFGA